MTQFLQIWARSIVSLTLLGLCLSSHAQNASAVYGRVVNSVGIVIVLTFEGELVASGSAVTVASQTMVTNRHVLLPGHRYMVLMPGARHEAYMTNCDSVQDLCLLSVNGLEAKPVEFAEAGKLSVGDTVFAVGAPNELGNMYGVAAATKQKVVTPPQLTISNGMITALRPVEDGNIIQTNAAISPGSSGGGLFDINGRLAGITTFGMRNGQSLNMALPVNWVERLGVSGSPRKNETPALDNLPPAGATPQQRNNGPTSSIEVNIPAGDTNANTTEPNKGLFGTKLEPKPWWAAIPALLLLWLFIRRKNDAGEIDASSVYIPPPITVDPRLQSFIDKAAQEFDSNQTDERLWKQIWLENKGNKEGARAAYIQKRATRLLSAEKDKEWAQAVQHHQTAQKATQ